MFALILVLLCLLVLAVLAGTRLQLDRDMRQAISVTLATSVETIGDSCERAGEVQTFFGRHILWAKLSAVGPGGEYSARIENVTGAVRVDSGVPLPADSCHHVAWEDSADFRHVLGYEDSRRLMVIWIFESPRVFWFVTPRSEAWAPASHVLGWILRADPTLEFDLVVIEETTGANTRQHITVDLSGETPSVDLTEKLRTVDDT